MRKGTGEGRTRADHPAVAAQLVAALARARQSRDLAELIGTDALTGTDRRYLALADAFTSELVNQATDESRTLDDTLARAWRVVSELPRRELTMLSVTDIDTYYSGRDEGDVDDGRDRGDGGSGVRG
jgi:V/A-type H+-transporting ATPase subunit B